MKIKKIAHFGYCVKDINNTIEFYTKAMGFKLTYGPAYADNDSDSCAAMGFNLCLCKECILEDENGITLEFIQYENPVSEENSPPMNVIGKGHIAYVVDDINAWVEKFRSLGMEIFYKPLRTEFSDSSFLWAYVRDPDGIVIEFIQYE